MLYTKHRIVCFKQFNKPAIIINMGKLNMALKTETLFGLRKKQPPLCIHKKYKYIIDFFISTGSL